MKTIRFLLLFGLATVWCQGQTLPQFTRVTAGPVATDLGHATGISWADYDNDGFVDLLVVRQLWENPSLYHNQGNGTFAAVPDSPVAGVVLDGTGGTWGDIDNDGDLDLFVATYGTNLFFLNDGKGTLQLITQGVDWYGPWLQDQGECCTAAWGDLDNDGWLDLHVANFAGRDFLYRNNGKSAMLRLSNGVTQSTGATAIGAWADFDGDGDLDLYVVNGTTGSTANSADTLWRNNGAGGFELLVPPQYPGRDNGLGLSASWADYDNDGDLDLFVSNGASIRPEKNFLFRNNGGVFTPVTSGVTFVGDTGSHIGSAWGDYDNDGWLDLFIVGGKGGTNQLYHNQGDGTFVKVQDQPPTTDAGVGFGCAWADYDNDGYLDLCVANGDYSGPAEACGLYHNQGGTNGWLRVRLVGAVSNRSAIGAKVRIQATIHGRTFWQMREVASTSGVASQGDLRVHFGLGDAAKVAVLRVEWPSGKVQVLGNIAVGQEFVIIEPPLLQIAARPAGGQMGLRITGLAGAEYTLLSSSNLVDWAEVRTITLTNRSQDVQVPVEENLAAAFLKLLSK